MLIDFRKLFPKYNLQFKGVLHVGANVGEEFDVYNELGMLKQFWIEANPKIYETLKQNVSSNDQAITFNVAAGNEDKQIVLHISNNHSQSSSILQLGTHKVEHPDVHYVEDVEVTMFRVDSLFHASHLTDVDFLNIDVQGFELNVLKGMGMLINRFKAVYLEVNKDYVYEGCALIEDIDLYLGAFGFERVETKWAPNKNWGDALYIKSN